MEEYYPCCGKSICGGCIHSFRKSGNNDKCPFCNSDQGNKTEEDKVADMMKRVEANDAASICVLAAHYNQGLGGVQQDHIKAIELFTKSADLGFSKAHNSLGGIYHDGGEMKKANSILRLRLWQGMKWQDTTLETWRQSWETWNKLLSIGQLQHQLGIIEPCIT
jgi:TPR repeat protein